MEKQISINQLKILPLLLVCLSYNSLYGQFPQAPVIDDFNRAQIGPNWLPTYNGGIQITNNKVVAINQETHASVWHQQFGPDCEAYYTLCAELGNKACLGPSVRMQAIDIKADQYLAFFCQQGAGGQQFSVVNIWKRRSGSWSLLTTKNLTTDRLEANQQIGIRAVGNLIEAYHEGQVVASFTDNNDPILNAGYVQCYAGDDVGHEIDDFGAGTVTIEPPKDLEITSPTPGSTLVGSSQPFTWQDGVTLVTSYWLQAGSAVRGYDYYNSGNLGTSTTDTATGLPTDGSTVYVTLWYTGLGSGGWVATDYQYTAANEGGGSADPVITSPPSGTVLGTSQLFVWDPGTVSVNTFWIQAGSSLQAYDYYDSGALPGSATSHTVTGMPGDGSTIYITHWYIGPSSGGWVSFDYVYP